MAVKTKAELKKLFEDGDKPDQDAFGDLIDSLVTVDQTFIVHDGDVVVHDGDVVTPGT
jgi:hypothetical protein